MNVEVGVGSFKISFTAKIIEPTLTLQLKVENKSLTPCSFITYSTSTLISINGHSLSAINPNYNLLGGMATLVMA